MQLLAHLTEFDTLFVAVLYLLGFASGSAFTWLVASRRRNAQR